MNHLDEMKNYQNNPASTLGEALAFCSLAFSVVLLLDPLRNTDAIVALKYAPIILNFSAMFFLCLAPIPRAAFKPIGVKFTIILCGAMIVGATTSLLNGATISETYLGRGLNLTPVISGAIIAARPESLAKLSYWLIKLIITVSILGYALLIMKSMGFIYSTEKHILHIETTMFVAGLIYLCRKRKSSILRALVLSTLIWLGVETGKSTTLLLAAIFLALTTIHDILEKTLTSAKIDTARRHIYQLAFFLIVPLLAVTFLTYIATVIAERAGRYTNDLRLDLWAYRWEKFTESPFLGQLFTDSPVFLHPTLFNVELSTHNDYLDILSSGGVVFGSAYILTLLFAVRRSRRLLSNTNDNTSNNLLSIYPIVFLCFLAASTGNPFLPIPKLATIAYFSLGVILVTGLKKKVGP